jgi:hypothetical protein
MQPHHDHTTSAGTITGTLFTVCVTIDMHDYLKTIVLAPGWCDSEFCCYVGFEKSYETI